MEVFDKDREIDKLNQELYETKRDADNKLSDCKTEKEQLEEDIESLKSRLQETEYEYYDEPVKRNGGNPKKSRIKLR